MRSPLHHLTSPSLPQVKGSPLRPRLETPSSGGERLGGAGWGRGNAVGDSTDERPRLRDCGGHQLLPSDFAALTTAPKDATRFMEWIGSEDGGGVPESNRRLIITAFEVNPDKPIDWKPEQDDIDQALEVFWRAPRLEKEVGKQDKEEIFLGRRLYFYFAGHGYGHKPDRRWHAHGRCLAG